MRSRGEHHRQVEASLLAHRQVADPLAEVAFGEQSEFVELDGSLVGDEPGDDQFADVRVVDLLYPRRRRCRRLLGEPPDPHDGIALAGSRRRFDLTGEHCEQRRLAGAVGSGDDEPRTGEDGQADRTVEPAAHHDVLDAHQRCVRVDPVGLRTERRHRELQRRYRYATAWSSSAS